MIVVDTNVMAYLLIKGQWTDLALRVREKDPSWRLPSLWRHELTNVFATYVRQGGLAAAEATRTLEAAVAHFRASEAELAPAEILEFAVKHRISAYDAQYGLLARRLGVRCVTEDRTLRKALPDLTLSMSEFCD